MGSTVTRVASVLGCLAQTEELRVTAVAGQLGLPRSTASRLLAGMASAGLLQRVPQARRYRRGPLLQAAARGAGPDLAEAGAAALAPLVDRFGHTGFVLGLNGAEVEVLRVLPGSRAIRAHVPGHLTGGPAFCRSPGRALLARFPDHEVRARHPGPLAPLSPRAPGNVPELLRRLAATRRRGFAEACDEGVPGIGGIGVAVGTARDRAVGLSLAFPAGSVDAAERRQIGLAMLEMVRGVGRRLADPLLPRMAG